MKTPQTPAPWSQHRQLPAKEIKIIIHGNEWTYTQAEAEDAVLWLYEDARYLDKQAETYNKKNMPWLAEQTKASANNSRQIAETIKAAIQNATR